MADRDLHPGASSRNYRIPVAIIVVLTLIAGVVLLFNYWPLLRGTSDWAWTYAGPTADAVARLVPSGLVLLSFWVGLHLLRRGPDWLYLIWCIIGSVAVPVVLLMAYGDPFFVLFSRTISESITGAFAYSLAITDLSKTAGDWSTLMTSLRSTYPHLAISSPLWPMLYYSVQGVSARFPGLSGWLASLLIPLRCQDLSFVTLRDAQVASAWLGIASPLWAALAAIPLFQLGKQAGGRDVARTAVAWWPLLPALTMFAATLNTAYLPLSTASIAVLWGSLRAPGEEIPLRAHLGRLVAGALVGALILWNFSLAPLLLLFALLVLLRWLLGGTVQLSGLRWALVAGIELVFGVAAAGGLYVALVGHSPLEPFRVSMQIHTSLLRPYWPWLALHTWDLILFTGLPVCALAVFGGFARRDVPSFACHGTRAAPFRQFGLALGATLAILILSGTARGETGRVWMFFMPLIVLLAAGGLDILSPTQRGLLAVNQVLWLLVVALVLRTVMTDVLHPPPTYGTVAYPSMTEPVVAMQADFGDQLRLLGYQARYDPGSRTLDLALHWQAMGRLRKPYYFSAIPVAPGRSAKLPSTVWQPFGTHFPTTCWPARPEVVDQVRLFLGDNPQQGDWWVSLSAFEFRENQPPLFLPVHLPGGREDQQAGLGPLRVGAGN